MRDYDGDWSWRIYDVLQERPNTADLFFKGQLGGQNARDKSGIDSSHDVMRGYWRRLCESELLIMTTASNAHSFRNCSEYVNVPVVPV